MAHRVTLIPGDGTGPELTEATRRVLDATGVEFEWDVQPAGADVMAEHGGNPLPEETLESIRRNGVALKGPITTPIGEGFRSVNVGLRVALDLYAQVRPCKTYAGVRTRYDDVDLVIVRETTEDIYAGIEFEQGTPEAEELIAWLDGARRQAAAAGLGDLDQADLDHGHPPGVRVRVRLRAPDGPPQDHRRPQGEHHEVHRRPLAARRARGRRGERRHRVRGPDRGQHVHAARPAARRSTTCMVLPNLYGDIISDLAAGLIGGLGVAPGANFGRRRRGLRADARLGAEVRRPEQGQPDRADALRRC